MAKFWKFCSLLLAIALSGCLYETIPEGSADDMSTNRNPAVLPAPPQGMPQVVPTIPRNGLWSGYNQLGYQAKYGPDRRQTQTILKLDEWGPPEVWTISLYTKQDFKTFDGYDIHARVNFGAGGSTQVYVCDWLNGTQISLPMNAVNVEALFEDVSVSSEGAGLSIGVQLSRGARGGTQPPILTLHQNVQIAPFGRVSFPLPAFARRVVALNTASPTAPTAIAAFFSATTDLAVYSGNNVGSIVTGRVQGNQAVGGKLEVPIIGSSRFIYLENRDPAVTIAGSIYVELDG